jgi:hypothetical protein
MWFARRDIRDIIVFTLDEINTVNVMVKPLVKGLGSEKISWCIACRGGAFSHPKQSGRIISIRIHCSLLYKCALSLVREGFAECQLMEICKINISRRFCSIDQKGFSNVMY